MASRIKKDPPTFELTMTTNCFSDRPIEPDLVRSAQDAAGEEGQAPGAEEWGS